MTEETNPAMDAEAAPGLSIGDLAALKSIVEVAANRGAFRAEEMEVVGKAYNKLAAFVTAALPAQTEEEETAKADTEEAPAEEA